MEGRDGVIGFSAMSGLTFRLTVEHTDSAEGPTLL